MRYWLIKSEPDVFSIDDLARSPGRRSGWDGVRNYQARNFLREMAAGDRAFFYHSNADPSAVAGVVEVVRTAYPDGEDPRWCRVDVRLLEKLPRPVSLGEIKRTPELKGMALLKLSRLSVQPVTPAEWRKILRMGGAA